MWFYKFRTFLYNLTVPLVTTEYVIKNNLSYSSKSEAEQWLYYWEGDLETGHEVRVSVEEQRNFLKKGRK